MPVVGRVSMDLITLDVTSVPDLAVGDRVELMGPHLPVDDVAEAAGTNGYEVLTRLARASTACTPATDKSVLAAIGRVFLVFLAGAGRFGLFTVRAVVNCADAALLPGADPAADARTSAISRCRSSA